MKKAVLISIGLLTVILLSYSLLSVKALNSDEWYWSSSGMYQSYYQGDSGTVTLIFYSQCPDQLQISSVNIQFNWMTQPDGYALANPVNIATNGQYSFTAINFNIPADESLGTHSYTVTFQGQQQYTGGFLGIGNGWKSITATGTGSITVNDSYAKVYSQILVTVQSSLNNAQNSNYQSPDAQASLQQANTMYNEATSLAQQGQWQGAVNDLNAASNDLSQSFAQEAAYTPPQTPTPPSIAYTIGTPTPTATVTPATPEFPSLLTIIIVLVAVSLGIMATVRKRKMT